MRLASGWGVTETLCISIMVMHTLLIEPQSYGIIVCENGESLLHDNRIGVHEYRCAVDNNAFM